MGNWGQRKRFSAWIQTAMWDLKWRARWELNLSSSTFWLLDQSSCNASLLAVCQRSGETCHVTKLSSVKAVCNKSCKQSLRVHETRGFGAEVETPGENGSSCYIEGIKKNTQIENAKRAFCFFFSQWLMCLVKRVGMRLFNIIKNHHCEDEDFQHHHTGWLDICQNPRLSTLASFKLASDCRGLETWSRQEECNWNSLLESEVCTRRQTWT